MMKQARDRILSSLKSAEREPPLKRPPEIRLNELGLDAKQMIERFSAELAVQTGIMHRASDAAGLRCILTEIAAAEGIRRFIASSDPVVKSLELGQWGIESGIEVMDTDSLISREALKEAAFSADAGITAADFAVAESGTIGISASKDMPRLASIALPVHIAVIPSERIFPTYETAMKATIMDSVRAMPSQVIFITGPSSTADIQATPFKGMHGPGRLFVILLG